VVKNFVGIPQDQLLERLLELTLYAEENLAKNPLTHHGRLRCRV
jgi:hypothetical protein